MTSEDDENNQKKNAELLGNFSGVINRKVNSGLDYLVILDDIFDFLDPLIPFDRIGIALLEQNGEQVRLKWVKSKIPAKNLNVGYVAPLKGSSLDDLAKTWKPRIINDVVEYLQKHPSSKSTASLIRDGMLSSLTFPLSAGNEAVGFAFFSSAKPNAYRDAHIELFSGIVDELSMLVQYGKLNLSFESKKSSGEVLRSTLHELRSPLSIIQGYVELMKDKDWFHQLDDVNKNLFSILQRNTDAMFGIISELANSEKPENDPHKIKKQEVTLATFCREIAADGNILATRKKINFELKISAALPLIWIFDPYKIKQVLDNLLTNAVKFSHTGSKITFIVNLDSKNNLVFSVEDTGQGIPQNEIHNLFQKFGKTSVRPTAGESSTGLGLNISKQIITSHGGNIGVESKVGIGSVFSLSLPV